MRIIHFGNDVDSPGGVAAVIQQHVSRSIPGAESITSVSTYVEGAVRGVKVRRFLSALEVALNVPLKNAIVHVHLTRRGSLVREGVFLWIARARRSRMVVATIHGSSASEATRLTALSYRIVLAAADKVHLLSRGHVSILRSGDSRAVLVQNDVRIPSECDLVETRDRRVVFLGQLSRRKGLDVLISAWRELRPADWSLVLCGESVDESAALTADLPDGVECRGLLSRGEVTALLSKSAIVALPSRAEAMPMAICEAMAFGCALVATDVGGICELVGEDEGPQIARVGSSSDLADKLRIQIGNVELRSGLGARNRLRAEQLFGQDVDEKWTAVYSSGGRR